MASQARYGYLFHGGESDLEIELWMIARHKGDTFDNFMRVRKLLWPDRYRHRWTDLMYRNFIDNDVTVLMGSASAQKTSHAVEYVLINYFARPEQTMVVLSTLNMDKLDIGCWAELQMLWKAARERYPELPGNLVAHKRAIATDNLAEVGSRDFRKGCICRPCFPAGTLVDTPNGKMPIESIKPGDVVYNAAGTGRVIARSVTSSRVLVRIVLKDGRSIRCTPDHPFFTQKGWEKACDLSEKHYIMSPHETMRILREPVRTEENNHSILQRILRLEMGPQQTRNEGFLFEGVEGSSRQESSMATVSVHSNEAGQSHAQSRELRESSCGDSGFGGSSSRPWREWNRTIESGVAVNENVPRRSLELSGKNRNETREWIPNDLQSRPWIPELEAGNRSGWRKSQQPNPESERSKENGIPSRGSWVDRVEVYKQSDIGFPNTDRDSRRCRVYNLEVKGHPSYCVNGLVAHNCYIGGKWVGLGVLAGTKQDYLFFLCDELQHMAETFAQSWPHLFSNGHVKIIGSGNPKHDPDDQLSIAAEPKEGWNSMPEPEKTVVWDTKFMGGKCINLVGTDSPNFDVPEGKPAPYPKLINRAFANRIAHDHGPESFEYYRLIKGVMKVAFAHSRVITRQLCREHHALEGVIWKDNNQTRLYGLDPSYGGEDRCVGMPMKFGEDTEGNQILLIMPYRVFPINMRLIEKVSVEDQIANILEEELKTYDIPVENVGYDACGKGTIGAAFGRKFGFSVPQAIDSGAQPTKRPVRADLFVEEDNGQRRLKTCAEHYSKFVSEMWFSWRYVIEANQLRGLTEDIMAEGCARVYEVVAGNKIEVEPKSNPKKKEDLKRRLGKSPDLADCCCIGIEMARRLGFSIDRLGAAVNPQDDDDFFEQEAKEWQEELQSHHLTHA